MFDYRSRVLGLASALLASLAAAAPPTPNMNEDGAKERLLRVFGKDSKYAEDVVEAKFKYLVYREDGEGWVAVAGNELTFVKGRAHISPIRAVIATVVEGKEILSAPVAPRAELEFDRPVRSLEDIRGAKLRTLHFDTVSMCFGLDKP